MYPRMEHQPIQWHYSIALLDVFCLSQGTQISHCGPPDYITVFSCHHVNLFQPKVLHSHETQTSTERPEPEPAPVAKAEVPNIQNMSLSVGPRAKFDPRMEKTQLPLKPAPRLSRLVPKTEVTIPTDLQPITLTRTFVQAKLQPHRQR